MHEEENISYKMTENTLKILLSLVSESQPDDLKVLKNKFYLNKEHLSNDLKKKKVLPENIEMILVSCVKKKVLGNYPVIQSILATVNRNCQSDFKKYLYRAYKANEFDAEDIIQDTYLSLIELEPRGEIKQKLDEIGGMKINSIPEYIKEKLRQIVIALFKTYMDYKYKEKHFSKRYYEITSAGIEELQNYITEECKISIIQAQFLLTKGSVKHYEFPPELNRICGIRYSSEKEYLNSLIETIGEEEVTKQMFKLLIAGKIHNKKIYSEKMFCELLKALICQTLNTESEDEILNIFKKEKNNKQMIADYNTVLLSEEDNLRIFLVDLSPTIGTDIDKFLEGDTETIEQFYRCLCEKARLDEKEEEFLFFNLRNPDAKESSFDQEMMPFKISRIKTKAFVKLVSFFNSVV